MYCDITPSTDFTGKLAGNSIPNPKSSVPVFRFSVGSFKDKDVILERLTERELNDSIFLYSPMKELKESCVYPLFPCSIQWSNEDLRGGPHRHTRKHTHTHNQCLPLHLCNANVVNYNIIINKLFFLLKNNTYVCFVCVCASKVAF